MVLALVVQIVGACVPMMPVATAPQETASRSAVATATAIRQPAVAPPRLVTPIPIVTATGDPALVTQIVDGDTITVRIGGEEQTVRFIGLDAAEIHDPDPALRNIAEQAAWTNAELMLGKRVRLEKDHSDTDRYGRLLRYVWVDDLMVNAELVRRGLADAVRYPPDVKHHQLLSALEEQARRERLGLWALPEPELSSAAGQIVIVTVHRDGKKENEPDEYVEIRNIGSAAQDMSGWRLESERRFTDRGQIFTFPDGFEMQPQQACRIYTDEIHANRCGLSFRHSGSSIWHNSEPDAAMLYDAFGNLVSQMD